MLRPIIAIVLLGAPLVNPGVAYAFELDGLRSGMTKNEAIAALKRISVGIDDQGETIIAGDKLDKPSARTFALNFCKGRLVSLQKLLLPRWDYFVRLVQEKRRELGRPADVLGDPSDTTSTLKSDAVRVVWRYRDHAEIITYTKFPANDQLDIVLSVKNDCGVSVR